MRTTWSKWLLASVCAASLFTASGGASGRERALTGHEINRLMHGETVQRDETLTGTRGRRYVGGVTYTVIEGTVDELARVFDDTAAYEQILPKTKSARIVGADGSDAFVELRQGNALAEACYTIRVRNSRSGASRDGLGTDEVREQRFWLDPSRPHGIDDAWGFFRYEALPSAPGEPSRVLVTFGVLVDLGPGLVRDFFEERVRSLMLSVPQRMRAYLVEPSRRASAKNETPR